MNIMAIYKYYYYEICIKSVIYLNIIKNKKQ